MATESTENGRNTTSSMNVYNQTSPVNDQIRQNILPGDILCTLKCMHIAHIDSTVTRKKDIFLVLVCLELRQFVVSTRGRRLLSSYVGEGSIEVVIPIRT